MTIVTAVGQQVSTDAKAAAAKPRPAQIDRNGALTLIRTAIIALQQANQTNDYRVLYAMSAPGFQKFTPVEKLADNFAGLRNSKFDLSGVAVLDPQLAAQTDENGVLRLAGYFPSAPMQINFDLQFTPMDNRWRLLGITVTVSPSAPIAPSTTSPTVTPKAAASSSPAKGKKK